MKAKQNYNKEILVMIKEKYGFSFDYIRKAIRGDRTGMIPDRMKTEYEKLTDQVKKTILIESQKL
ncbi:hypothetical protein ACFFLS_07115 [Flavobacterium procerum]|uniref:Uncharacterized protein n=1 Tax=Flavobacterium procerum TaxID=1455569 RepID=A0ABV6BMY2_9FLAO